MENKSKFENVADVDKEIESSEPASIFDLVKTDIEETPAEPGEFDLFSDHEPEPDEDEPDARGEAASDNESQKMPESVAKREAKGITTFIEFIVSRGCSAYSGEQAERYKMSKEEKNDFIDITALAIQDVGGMIPPIWQFIGALLALLAGMGFLAYEDKNANERKERALAKARAQKLGFEIDREIFEDMGVKPHNKSGLGRQQFQIDKNGYYYRNESGTYIKASDPLKEELKAPKMIVDIVRKLEREGKTTKDVNQYILENVSFEDRNRYE